MATYAYSTLIQNDAIHADEISGGAVEHNTKIEIDFAAKAATVRVYGETFGQLAGGKKIFVAARLNEFARKTAESYGDEGDYDAAFGFIEDLVYNSLEAAENEIADAEGEIV